MADTLIVAHRGDAKRAPESTLPAFVSAVAVGADTIEFDVHLTKDGKLVVHHDTYLGRTERATGYIGDYTLSELQSLDVGVWFGTQFQGTRMPTLADVLALASGSIRFEIELRTPSLVCLQETADAIATLGLEEDVELTSPHVPLLCRSRESYPHLRTGLFFALLPSWMHVAQQREYILSWLALSAAQVAHLPLTIIDESLVRQAHDRGLRIHGSDLNSASEIRAGLDLQID